MTGNSVKPLLGAISSRALLTELVERGVIRQYGVSEYVPGIVRARSSLGDEAFDNFCRARVTTELVKATVMQGVAWITSTPATERDKDAPPSDLIYEASILTLDPAAVLD